MASNRESVGEFTLTAQAVVIASGGIGGNHDLIRRWWPDRLGTPPATMLTGVPAYVDGRMLDIADAAGVRLVNRDRMWYDADGVANWAPVWPGHGIRILSGPSSVWLDALGRRLPALGLPGHGSLGTLRMLRTDPDPDPYDHSWFILTQRIIEKEFALSGSEQNPDLIDHDLRLLLATRLGRGAPPPVEAFKRHGEDFVVADTLPELVAGMNALTGDSLLDPALIERQIQERDRQLANPFAKDAQVLSIRNARRYRGDRLLRVARLHRILDPAAGPLVAVRLRVITRKSLGGIQTDLDGRALGGDGMPVPGLYAVGEAAGFGGGGAHGHSSLEGGACSRGGRWGGRSLAGCDRGLGWRSAGVSSGCCRGQRGAGLGGGVWTCILVCGPRARRP